MVQHIAIHIILQCQMLWSKSCTEAYFGDSSTPPPKIKGFSWKIISYYLSAGINWLKSKEIL